MTITVTIKTTQTATFDIGDLPVGLVRDLLTQNDGTFDGNYSIGDIRGADEKYVTNSVEVVEK